MKKLVVILVWVALAVPVKAQAQDRLPDIPVGKLHACDLVEEIMVSNLFPIPLTHRYPNRQATAVEGAVQSVCKYYATAQNSIQITLYEFPDEAAAVRAYSKYTANTEYLVNNSKARLSGVGSRWRIWEDSYAVTSWHLGEEAHGFTVRKAKRLYLLEARWAVRDSDAKRNEQLMPLATFAAKKL